jgi:ABC-type sugar transport system substrate-binding protein
VHSRRSLIAGAALGVVAACRRSRTKLIGVVPKATSHLFFVWCMLASNAHRAIWRTSCGTARTTTDHTRQIQIVDAMAGGRARDLRPTSGFGGSAGAGAGGRNSRDRLRFGGEPESYVSFVATDNYNAGCTAAGPWLD